MDTQDPTVVNITTVPTTKEQLISYGLGIAFVAVSVAVTVGVTALGTWAVEKYLDAKESKAEAKTSADKE